MKIESNPEKVYHKNGQFILIDKDDSFVYQTCVYVRYKNYFSLIKNVYFSSPKEISGVVGTFYKTPNIQIVSELFSAPKHWIKDNGFSLYIPPEKTKQVKNKKQ